MDGHLLPILPKVGGFVAQVRVEENQPVKAGDTLVVLDDRELRAKLAQSEADLAALLATVSSRTRVGQAEAAVAQAQANALKAHADLDRLLPLARQDIVSKQQIDAAQASVSASDAQLAQAQAALLGADARVAAARAARDQAALQLSYTSVIAPQMNGEEKKRPAPIVSANRRRAGQSAPANTAAAASGREFIRNGRNERPRRSRGGARSRTDRRIAGLPATHRLSENAVSARASEGKPGAVFAKA